MMKKLMLILLLLFVTPDVSAQVFEQTAVNNQGRLVVRLQNRMYRATSCFFQDQYSYYTFVIPAGGYSMWYIAYGPYRWQCR